MTLSRFRGLYGRLFLAHVLVIVAGAVTLLAVTLLTAHTLHDRLMVAWLGPDATWTTDPVMAEMERATNAVFEAAMIQALVISGGAAIGVAVAVSLVVSRRVALPIQDLLRASQRIAAGHYHERVSPAGSEELAALAQQFNLMAETLEHAERRRVALIGDVAHELRTPLATIEGYAEGVLDGVVTANGETWALILDEVGRLRRLVADLQELSRAEARQLPLRLAPMAPATLVDRAMARLKPQFDDKGVALTCTLPLDLPPALADADRVAQVLINLLGNALQHTPAGGNVNITVWTDVRTIWFQVRDTGSGIAAEHLPYLFERFYRVDKSRTRTTGGTGVGLTICKALVEAHGGRIWGESEGLGRGATFTFTLPVHRCLIGT
ncbi:sensor histidine kinase [Roseiflexus castenholzii]|uniref:histidine kinase n=1 Tax=Roseiflexus castenholzii (strain DSM 13941 / HLO8) TaxID=383372 RepID=A7NMT1_ROSCS|nr:ATP-binding protein [Roseiflexus castenholzii]ABU58852.1 integral membrane sensor signal transduction histidine kinase [Roseiflexus castenholzii DSM 13941]